MGSKYFYILEYHKDCINELYLAKECDKITFSKIAKSGFKIKNLILKLLKLMRKVEIIKVFARY